MSQSEASDTLSSADGAGTSGGFISQTDSYDVVVVGGAFSGGSLAWLLKQWRPETRILVVERRDRFDRKVGEATVEMSGMFLHRVLGLYDHLSREHLPKHGLRFWFAADDNASLEKMSEIGASGVSALPSFQLDRSKLDEAILARAVAAGVELVRPARAEDVELGWPESSLTVTGEHGERRVRCRWLIDASGRHNLLGRKLGLMQRLTDHPTNALWARWRGVRDLDGPAVQGPDPERPAHMPLSASRRLATNHFCGYGWWIWVIPLAGGETSVGLVYDKRHFTLEGAGRPAEQYEAFLRSRPGLRELLEDATLIEGDFHGRTNLAFSVDRYMDRGWAIVGDAASFIDPYYSPGLDHAAFSIYSTARFVERQLREPLADDALGAAIAEHNGRFARSFRRSFEALYRDKYELFGDAELTVASFLVDTALYYIGVVTPAMRRIEEFRHPMLGEDMRRAALPAAGMAFFRRRMVRLARFRRSVGTYGRRNEGWKHYLSRFQPGAPAFRVLASGIRIWLSAELQFAAHRLRHGSPELSAPVTVEAAPPVLRP